MDNTEKNVVQSFLFPSAISSVAGAAEESKKELEKTDDYNEGPLEYNWLSLESYKDVPTPVELTFPSESSTYSDSASNSQENAQISASSPVRNKSKKKTKQKKKKDIRKRKPKTIWLDEALRVTDEPYRIDKTKDHDNLQFNTLYRLDVARSNIKYFKCLGIKGKNSVAYRLYAKKKLKKRKITAAIRYHDVRKYDNATTCFQSTQDKKSTNYAKIKILSQEFLPLDFDEKSTAKDDKDQLEINKDPFTSTIEEFNIYLRDTPLDINKWLEFCEFQGKLVQGDLNVSTTFTNESILLNGSQTKIIVEKQISILERALEKNPTSMELIMKYMSLCREVTEYEDYNKKWKNMIFKQPNNITLWRQFLLTSYSSFANFNVTSCLSDYKKCFSMLIAIQEGVMVSHQPGNDFIDGMIGIFLQQAIFLSQAGYTEKAIALFQSLIEFNCFCPDDLQQVTPELRRNLFQCYFESEFPRIGDCSCSGWNIWYSKYKDDSTFAPLSCTHINSKDTNIEEIDKKLKQKMAWLKLECLRSEHQFIPYRQTSSNNDDCDDADRMILYSDVSYCLFRISSAEHQLQLLLTFLAFLGCPISLDLLSCHVKQIFLKTKEHLIYPTSSAILNLQLFKGIKTTNSKFFNMSSKVPDRNILSGTLLIFIREIFNQCLNYLKETSIISNVFLQFELIYFMNTVSELTKADRKIAKKALQEKCKSILGCKNNRNCLPLWTTYAVIENHLGNINNAKRVLIMALSSGNNTITDNDTPPYVAAHRFLMELELDLFSFKGQHSWPSNTQNKVITILSSLSSYRLLPLKLDGEQPTSLVLLKCKSDFENGTKELRKLLTSKNLYINHTQLCEWICCHAIFELFNSNLHTALSLLESALSMVKVIDISTLTDSAVLLMTYQTQLMKEAFNMGVITHKEFQIAVRDALCEYPHSLWLKELFTMSTDNFLNSLDVRRQLESSALKYLNPWNWLLAIGYEKLKQDKFIAVQSLSDGVNDESSNAIAITTVPTSGINHRIRSLFMKATVSEGSAYCISLWRRFIEFEVSLGNVEKAKHVYYRALQNCPWSKDLFQDSIEYLDEDFGNTLDLMLEKEVRVRLPVEEFDMLWNE